MKNGIYFFLVLCTIVACTTEELELNTDISENIGTDEAFAAFGSDCVTLTGQNLTLMNNATYYEIYKMGQIHNAFLGSLTGQIGFDDCSVMDTEALVDQIDDLITRNPVYEEFLDYGFDDNFFNNNFPICTPVNIEEYSLLLTETIDSFMNLLSGISEIPDSELVVLENFFIEALDTSSFEKINVESYYNQLDDLHTKYNEGLVSYLVLNIYDYSYCLWEEFAMENIPQTRFVPWLVAVAAAAQMMALGDATGALIETAIWLYDNYPNIEGPDKGNQLAKAALKAGVTTSTAWLGPLFDRLFFNN